MTTVRPRLALASWLLAASTVATVPARAGVSTRDYPSIQAAIDANPGRVVEVEPGVHEIRETLRIATEGGGLVGRARIVQLDPDLTLRELTFGVPATPAIQDRARGFYTYTLSVPLAPGATTSLRFALAYDKVGFSNDRPNTAIVANGSFLTMPCPQLGYQEGGELTDEGERRRKGLAPRPRMAPATDLLVPGASSCGLAQCVHHPYCHPCYDSRHPC